MKTFLRKWDLQLRLKPRSRIEKADRSGRLCWAGKLPHRGAGLLRS
jgi:hypothetical protein